jgi:F-type H+-transporting ATPase subunit a
MASEVEVDVWTTTLFNKFLAAPANSVLDAVGVKHDPTHPWSNWITMEILVILIMMAVFAVLKRRLSVGRPGKMQHIFEILLSFFKEQAHDNVGHAGQKYIPFFGTLFLFILFMNLIGVIPGFESPTMSPAVPCGLAVVVFLYYNYRGAREHGVGKYLAHFAGPIPWMMPLMIPIEIISHMARPLSLTIRLYANMYAGEQVTLAFLGLTFLVMPVAFQGLHVFVAFLQAFIFMVLAMVYVGSAVAHEEHD